MARCFAVRLSGHINQAAIDVWRKKSLLMSDLDMRFCKRVSVQNGRL